VHVRGFALGERGSKGLNPPPSPLTCIVKQPARNLDHHQPKLLGFGNKILLCLQTKILIYTAKIGFVLKNELLKRLTHITDPLLTFIPMHLNYD
jgi:hypothetical protein